MAVLPARLRPAGSTQAPVAPWSLLPVTPATAVAMDGVLDDGLADGSSGFDDNTYLAHDSSVSTDPQRIEFADFVIPVGSQIRSVQFRYRVHFPSYASGDNRTYQVNQHGATATRNAADTIYETLVASTSVMVYSGAVWTANPANLPWTQADINALALSIAFFGGTQGSTVFRLTELYADVVYNEMPAVTVTSPAEAGTVATTRPTVTWTYSDPEADQQERFQVKVYSDDQYLDALFNVETSIATHDSGVVYSNATSYAIPTDLINGETYRVYVRAADQGSGGRWSNWTLAASNNTFQVVLTAAAVPTMTVTPEPANARVKIDFLANDELGTHIILEYSDDAGETWVTHRAGNLVPVDPPTNLLTIYDNEIPSGKSRQYRGRATTFDGSKTSNPSASQTVTMPFTSWWLKDPLFPALNQAVMVEGGEITMDLPESTAVFEPLGRARKVVLSGDIRGVEMQVTFIVTTQANRDALHTLRNAQRTLLLQSPIGEQWYVRPTSWQLVRHAFSPNVWRLAAQLIEVDPPDEIILASDIFTLDVSLLG